MNSLKPFSLLNQVASTRIFPSFKASFGCLRNTANLTQSAFLRTAKGLALNHSQHQPKINRYFSSSIGDSLTSFLKTGKDHYLFLQRATNEQKVEQILQQALQDSLALFNQKDLGTSTQESWDLLKDILKTHSVTLPSFNDRIMDENSLILFRLFPQMLLKGSNLTSTFREQDYLNTPNEFYWSAATPTFSFTRPQENLQFEPSRISYILDQASTPEISLQPVEQEIQDWIYSSSSEDSLGAILLTTPYLDEATVVHEVGCWNGENLFNLLYHAYLNKKTVAGCIGTDINTPVLNIAQTVRNMLGLKSPSVQFHLANALHPIHLTSLGLTYRKEVKVALRVIPILDPKDAKKFLSSTRQSFTSKDSVLVLSYALLKGAMYEKNKQRVNASSIQGGRVFREEPFNGGTIFKTPFPSPSLLPDYLKNRGKEDIILNTYYSEEGFNKLATECGFKVLQKITVGDHSDNYRAVVVLAPN